MAPAQAAMRRRTQLWFEDRPEFIRLLVEDVRALERRAKAEVLLPAARLNATSDVPWERHFPFAEFPNVQFYDYTKNFKRMERFLTGEGWPPNYHLTFSRSEKNEKECRKVLEIGGSITIVTRNPLSLPSIALVAQPVDGDAHDLTFLHAPGSVLVLKAKGKARRDTTGFVLD